MRKMLDLGGIDTHLPVALKKEKKKHIRLIVNFKEYIENVELNMFLNSL